MTQLATAVRPGAPPARRQPRPKLLTALAVCVSVALLLPLFFLLLQASQVGWSTLQPILFRRLTGQLIWNTVSLTVVVTALCAVIGTVTAWFIERTNVPGRRWWAILVVVPLGIPDFVVSFAWRSLFGSLAGFWAAVLIMTVAVYPLVFLPVAASLRSADPAQEEVARSLGHGRLHTFWHITVGQARSAILGGCVLVALVLLAEYGAFEILGFRTLTTEIFSEFNGGFDQAAACALSLILVVLSIVILGAEGLGRSKGQAIRVGFGTNRVTARTSLGRSKGVVLAGLALLVGAALVVPIGAIVYLLFHGGSSTLPSASILSAAGHTFVYAAAAGLLSTAGAIPIALLSVRHRGRLPDLLERSNYLVLAMPGLVIALAFVYVAERYAAGYLYQSTFLLIVTYAIMFFPMALVAVRASIARAPIGLEEVGRSLGASRMEVMRRVTLPLIGPGLAAAFSLVFLQAATELTATLVLIPTGSETLSTQFWAFQSNTSYGQAAPYAAVMVLLAAVPSYVLGRWFDRLPARTQVAQ